MIAVIFVLATTVAVTGGPLPPSPLLFALPLSSYKWKSHAPSASNVTANIQPWFTGR